MASDTKYISKVMMENGWFNAPNQLIKENKITADEAAKLKKAGFELLAVKLKEASNEVSRIQAVLQRLEAICQQGGVLKPFAADGNDVVRLRQEAKALHGWIISLVETDYYLLARVESPTTARQKFQDLATSLSTLQAYRQLLRMEMRGKEFLFDV